MDEDQDFTFPTVAAAPEAPRDDVNGPAPATARLGDLLPPILPDLAAAAIWPFAAREAMGAAAEGPAVEDGGGGGGEAPAPASRRGEARAHKDEDEERMDLLWEGTAAAPRRSSGGRAGAEPPPKRRAEADDDKERADAERMDLLWESFNEDLLLRRARSRAAATSHRGGLDRPDADDGWCYLSPPSDAGSEETSASASSPWRPGYGCAPTMLRASSRAGGAGQFCASPRRRPSRSRGAAAGWTLLLRLFRRLFAVEKTAPSRRHGGIYVP